LVIETSLYKDARSEKHQIMNVYWWKPSSSAVSNYK